MGLERDISLSTTNLGQSSMARRAKAKRVRRRNTDFNLTQLVESAAYGSVMTQALFSSNIGTFLLGGEEVGDGTTLVELLKDPAGRLETAGERVMDTSVITDAAFKFVGLGIGFKLFNKLTRKPRSKLNRSFRQIGLPVRM